MTENEFNKSIVKLLHTRKEVIKKIKIALKNKVANFPITKDEKNSFLKDIYNKINLLNQKQMEDLKIKIESQKQASEESSSDAYHEVELSFFRHELVNNFRIDQRGFFQEAVDVINHYVPQYSNYLMHHTNIHYQEAFAMAGGVPEEFLLEMAGKELFTGFQLIFAS
jgi:hypothetical protein